MRPLRGVTLRSSSDVVVMAPASDGTEAAAAPVIADFRMVRRESVVMAARSLAEEAEVWRVGKFASSPSVCFNCIQSFKPTESVTRVVRIPASRPEVDYFGLPGADFQFEYSGEGA